MNTLKHMMGVALIVVGALLLIVSYIAGWTSSNLVLLAGLLLIVSGVVVHIRHQKKGGKY